MDAAILFEEPLLGSSYLVSEHNVICKVVKVKSVFSEELEDTFAEFKDRK